MTGGPPRLPDVPSDTIAIGWACVELERAQRELASLVADGLPFRDAPASVALGARCVVGRTGPSPDALRIVLLEPATEGRLAAYLARHGEGWAARWTATADGSIGLTLRSGPLGPERVAADAAAEPFRLGLETATIRP